MTVQIPLPRKILIRNALLVAVIGASGITGLGISASTRPGWGLLILTLVVSGLPAWMLFRLWRIYRWGVIEISSSGLKIRNYLAKSQMISWGAIDKGVLRYQTIDIVYEPHLGSSQVVRAMPPLDSQSEADFLRSSSAYRPDFVATYLEARGRTATWDPISAASLPIQIEIPQDRFNVSDLIFGIFLIVMFAIIALGAIYPKYEFNKGSYIAFLLLTLFSLAMSALAVFHWRAKWRDPGGPEFIFGPSGIDIRIVGQTDAVHYEWSALRSMVLAPVDRKLPHTARSLLLDLGCQIPITVTSRGGVTLFDVLSIILRYRPDLTLKA